MNHTSHTSERAENASAIKPETELRKFEPTVSKKHYRAYVITVDREGHRQAATPLLQSYKDLGGFSSELMQTGIFTTREGEKASDWIPPHCIMRVWEV